MHTRGAWIAACTIAMWLGCFTVTAPSAAQTRPATSPAATQPSAKFTIVDLYVDSGSQPLAAYQVEFAAEPSAVALVGVEGGEHAAFREPPYYDPAALSRNRIILAAFNTNTDLPTGKTRVARLHLHVPAGATPRYQIKLIVAASPEGKPIPAAIASFRQGEGP